MFGGGVCIWWSLVVVIWAWAFGGGVFGRGVQVWGVGGGGWWGVFPEGGGLGALFWAQGGGVGWGAWTGFIGDRG